MLEEIKTFPKTLQQAVINGRDEVQLYDTSDPKACHLTKRIWQNLEVLWLAQLE